MSRPTSSHGADGPAREGAVGEKASAAEGHGRSAAEWTSFGISLAIVLALVGLVGYLQFSRGSRPPTIDVAPRLDRVRQIGDVYYVPIDVANGGDLTAQDVRIVLAHASDGDRVQSSELRFEYLAGGETARGTVSFRQDPSRGSVGVDTLSFLEP